MEKVKSDYLSPEFEILEMKTGQCFANSLRGSSHDGFMSNDGYDDDYWNQNEVDL